MAERPRVRERLIAPRTLEDAQRLAAWAAFRVARGKLSVAESKAIEGQLRLFAEFIEQQTQDQKLADAKLLLAQLGAPPSRPGPPK